MVVSDARQRNPFAEEDELWPKNKETAGVAPGRQGNKKDDGAPRDVASMKAEIAELQSGTTASLDRAIAAAQATTGVASHTSTQLKEQREQMGNIDAEARGIDGQLRRTKYNLKYGLTWRGALTSPFRRSKPTAGGAGAVGDDKGEISPVFKDDYGSAEAPAHGDGGKSGSSRSASKSPKKAGRSLFGSSASSRKKGAESGDAAAAGKAVPKLPEHVPDGFETQLDTLDGLLDGLTVQAKAIGAELKQQNEGIEVLGGRVEPLRQETASQAKHIKRRFGVRG
ncbi:unnamed protein product [Scytosiphon promiscuus]